MKIKCILLILICYFFISIKESGIFFGVTQAYAGTDFIVIKTKECKPKVPETIFSWIDQAACEFNHSVVKPIQKCYDGFGSNSLKGLQCVMGITEKFKSVKPEFCNSSELSEQQSIICSTAESLQKVADCYSEGIVGGTSRRCAVNAIKDFHKTIQETGKTLISNTRDAVNIPNFNTIAATGAKDNEYLSLMKNTSPNANAIKEIQSKIAGYSGKAFESEIALAVENDENEQQKMKEERLERERLERERLERIAQAERERKAKIAQMEEAQRRYAEQQRRQTPRPQPQHNNDSGPSACENAQTALSFCQGSGVDCSIQQAYANSACSGGSGSSAPRSNSGGGDCVAKTKHVLLQQMTSLDGSSNEPEAEAEARRMCGQ